LALLSALPTTTTFASLFTVVVMCTLLLFGNVLVST
jgi:hypothetical protein